MIPTEIDDLEAGPKTDALVATKVMGWTLRDDCWFEANRNTGWRIDAPYFLGDWRYWNPSQPDGISAAWEVVEKLGSALTLQGPGSVDFNEGCGPWDTWEAGFGDQAWDFEHRATASTAALAICQAALKAANNSSKGKTVPPKT